MFTIRLEPTKSSECSAFECECACLLFFTKNGTRVQHRSVLAGFLLLILMLSVHSISRSLHSLDLRSVYAFCALGLIEHCRLSGIHIYELRMAWALWTNNKSSSSGFVVVALSAFQISNCGCVCGHILHICILHIVWSEAFCQCAHHSLGWCVGAVADVHSLLFLQFI